MITDQEIARGLVDVTDRAVRALRVSLDHLAPRVPVSCDDLAADERLTMDIDAFAIRFTRLQDMIGKHIFRTVLLVDEVRYPDKSAELLAMMEERQLVSVERWMLIRRARNGLTHDYPNDLAKSALLLSDSVTLAQEMLAVYDRVRGYILARARD
ncbi:hypothetical protein [Caenispirillum salinarum]|uniref:hypothetical protein n=1 Tax=Caenispirillum salinarum TaxID=859058 RepID=UPI00385028AA